MKKRSSIIFSILVAFIAMILLSCSSVTNNVVEIDNIIYHECDGYYVVDGPSEEVDTLSEVVIPDVIKGKKVKEIGNFAFDSCYTLNKVLIPSTVTRIGLYAFGSTNLKEITIPSSIENIDGNPFWFCNKLEKIIVDDNNGKYDSRNNCNAIIETKTNTLISGCKNTIIPNTVISIGEYAFYCSDLEELIIPANVKIIGISAFNFCDKLDDVYYLGTIDQWDSIYIKDGNDKLTLVTRYYYSETQPTDITGLYWHYVDGVPTKW